MPRILTAILCLTLLLAQTCFAGKTAPSSFAELPSSLKSVHVSPLNAPMSTDDDSVIFLADFETTGGDNAWTPVDLTNPGATWHRDVFNAYLGQYSYWSGKLSLMGYDNNWLQYLETDTFSLFGADSAALTFNLYWNVEPAEGPFPPNYDSWDGCNVWIWNGYTWELLQPVLPIYNSYSLYSFGWLWGFGPNVPGWTGIGSWQTATFDLSNYVYSPSLKLRFAFASDQSNCTADNPAWTGFFIDNIKVSNGSAIYLWDDAEGNPFPGPCTASAGPARGNFWVQDPYQAHSGTHSYNCDDQYLLSDALVSPPINIPAGMSTALSYWVYCDMPDYNGDHDSWLDDYYYIEVAPYGSSVWTPIAYDYARNGSQLQWVERTDGVWNSLPVPVLSLTPWAGQTVQLRFRVVTDENDDGGNGDGLYIDDVTLISHTLPNNDVGAYRLILPFPTYQGQTQVPGSVQLINYGLLDQSDVPAFWSVNGDTNALIPFTTILAGDTLTKTFAWTPPSAGAYEFKAYTHKIGDQDPTNDTCLAGTVEVTPPGLFELGYDHRQLTYLPENTLIGFNFGQGSGAMVHFTPEDDGLPGYLNGDAIKAMFKSTGTFTLHLFADDLNGQPGVEIYNQVVTIDTAHTYPNWAFISIADCAYLQGGHPNFWAWLEITSTNNTPHISGYLQDAYTYGHFYFYDGQTMQPTVVNFNLRATLTGSAAVAPGQDPEPARFSLLQSYPNPFNGTVTVKYSLPAPEDVRLEVFDALGRTTVLLLDSRMPAGDHQLVWEAEGYASGNYWVRLKAGNKVQTERIVLLK